MTDIAMILSVAAILCWFALGVINLVNKNFKPSKSDYWFAWALALIGAIESLVNLWVR